MTTCPKCSAELPPTARFCLECGERLPQPSSGNGDVVAIRSTVIQAGTVSLGAEADGGECPICGRHNPRTATFRCKGCNRPLICVRHQDAQSLLCRECVKQQRQKSKTVTVAPDGSGDFATLEEAVRGCVSGATIQLAEGEYALAECLMIDKPLTLVGAGITQTRVIGYANGPTLRQTGTGRLTLRKMSFAGSGGVRTNVVELTGAAAVVENCIFDARAAGDGAELRGASPTEEQLRALCAGLMIGGGAEVAVTQCQGQYGAVGIKVQDDARATVTNCLIHRCSYGILFCSSAGGALNGNTCRDNSTGIMVLSGSPGVQANVLKGNTETGIDWQSRGECLIEGNRCEDNGTGISVCDAGASHSAVVHANTCHNNATGILAAACGRSCSITNNSCERGGSSGMYLVRGDCRVADNRCLGNGDDGICWLEPENSASLIGNICSGNGKAGIFIMRERGAEQTMVLENECRNNKGSGICIWAGSPYVSSNVCASNAGSGIEVSYDTVGSIIDNTCENNLEYGISIPGKKSFLTSNKISGNVKGEMWPAGRQQS